MLVNCCHPPVGAAPSAAGVGVAAAAPPSAAAAVSAAGAANTSGVARIRAKGLMYNSQRKGGKEEVEIEKERETIDSVSCRDRMKRCFAFKIFQTKAVSQFMGFIFKRLHAKTECAIAVWQSLSHFTGFYKCGLGNSSFFSRATVDPSWHRLSQDSFCAVHDRIIFKRELHFNKY